MIELAARLGILADSIEALGRRLEAALRAESRARWSGPYRDRVEAEFGALQRRHRQLADELRAAAQTSSKARR